MAGWISIQIATLKKHKQINWLFKFGFWSPITKQAHNKYTFRQNNHFVSHQINPVVFNSQYTSLYKEGLVS